MAEFFIVGAVIVVIALSIMGAWTWISERIHPDRPRFEGLTLSREENKRRDAEYKRQLADWKASRGH